MSTCCYPEEYARIFRPGEARRVAARYRTRGLRGTARRLADEVAATGIDGAHVIEVGGGVSTIALDLLRRGAARATTIDLSPSWDEAAQTLAEDMGLADRVERLHGDAVDRLDGRTADVVVAHRVVCCYPYPEALMYRIARAAGRTIGLTYPVYRPDVRAVIAAGDLALRVMGRRFQVFVHHPARILGEPRALGFSVRSDLSSPVWRTTVLVREGGR